MAAEPEDLAPEEREEKQLADHSQEVDAQVPLLVEPAKADRRKVDAALDALLALEKKCRRSADVVSARKVVDAILRLLFHHRDWDALVDYTRLLVKRHGQQRLVITRVVQEVYEYVAQAPNDAVKETVINCLIECSEGKIYVEHEHAKLTRTLSGMKEASGSLEAASELMQDLQIETIGSMEMDEKLDFILEQFRLTLDTRDWVRAELCANKVNAKWWEKLEKATPADKEADADEATRDRLHLFIRLKLRYFDLLVRFHAKSGKYFEMAKAYLAIFRTRTVQASEAQWTKALRNAVIYLLIAPYDGEVQELMNALKLEKRVEQLKSCRLALNLFTRKELIAWPLPWNAEWKSDPIFLAAAFAEPQEREAAEARFQALHDAVVRHNVRVIAQYYKRITLGRLAQLLLLGVDDAEKHVCTMVQEKRLYARIDRVEGVCTFEKPTSPGETLDGWARNLGTLLGRVDNVCHLIEKEFIQPV